VDAISDTQLGQYIPVLMLLALALAFTAGMLGFSVLLGKLGRRTAVKDTAYECGIPPKGAGTNRFAVRFYLVAMLFILFDIEVIFLYPWAVVYRDMLPLYPGLIFGGMLSFLGILFVGYVYALKKGAFDWRR